MNTTLTNKYINIRDKQRSKQGENKTKVKWKDEKTHQWIELKVKAPQNLKISLNLPKG
jgi:hypothetical protein